MRIFLGLVFIFLLPSCVSMQVGTRQERTIKTFVGLKQENVVMQKYDFSCGVSSLLTLFKYHFGNDDLGERTVLSDFLGGLGEGRKKEVLESGLSVFDLKLLSQKLGYKVYAVTLKKESLLKLDRPILVYLETPDYKHFSVLRGVKNNIVFLADSSTGNTRMSLPSFLKMWKGSIAVFLDAPMIGVGRLRILPKELERPEILLLQSVL